MVFLCVHLRDVASVLVTASVVKHNLMNAFSWIIHVLCLIPFFFDNLFQSLFVINVVLFNNQNEIGDKFHIKNSSTICGHIFSQFIHTPLGKRILSFLMYSSTSQILF